MGDYSRPSKGSLFIISTENKLPSVILERNIEQKKGHTVLLGFIKHVRHGKHRIIIYIVNPRYHRRTENFT